MQKIHFANNKRDFTSTLHSRVNQYFKTNGIDRRANAQMRYKTVFMFLLYFIPFAFILSGITHNLLVLWLLTVVMGLGVAGIGLSVMHDANHGSYSRHDWVNRWLGYSLNLVGGSAMNWKIQHNVKHHTYTNIHEEDEDISPRGVLRMAPGSDLKFMHRYQHWYAWFFYGLMTIVWVLIKDYSRLYNYQKEGHLQRQKTTAVKEWSILILTKVFYLGYLFLLPLWLLPVTWVQVVVGFLTMHYVAGFILAIIFQPAHVIAGTSYPEPDDEGNIENDWTIHQMETTTNFANNSKWFTWYVGGLNYQIEHHLFPNICHVHYPAIAGIVKQTAEEFGVRYQAEPNFFSALKKHTQMLKILGQGKELPQSKYELAVPES
ncbi:MAG: acyl-CoA desaturase [Cyclobacteriaceae bacterium]|nr:acyl-CoA desaturase [Cyclobacteriaceae bacterium]